jgi:hypothetical protein
MQSVPPPPQAAQAQAAEPSADQPNFVIVSQRTENAVIASSDRPMVLVKAGRTEQALLRYVLFVVNTTAIVRPDVDPPGKDMLQWTFYAYLQRQICFTSITGLFSCAEPAVIPLKPKSEGRVPAPASPPEGPLSDEQRKAVALPPFVEVSRDTLYDALREQATATFDDDRRQNVDPLLKAAGVTVRAPSSAHPRPARKPTPRR